MTPKKHLEISITALRAYNVRPEIIKDMLKQLDLIIDLNDNKPNIILVGNNKQKI